MRADLPLCFSLSVILMVGLACSSEEEVPVDIPELDAQSDTETVSDLPLAELPPVVCTYDAFSAVKQRAEQEGASLFYAAESNTESPRDALLIELYAGLGDPPPLSGPGSYTLGASLAERSYHSCGTCIMLYTGCAEGGGCEKSYFAIAGELEVQSWGERFTGQLKNLELMEVTMDSQFRTTPVPNGEGYCIEEYPFDAPVNPRCESDDDCLAGYCLLDSGKCYECITDAHCEKSIFGQICHPERFCVGCLSDAQCPPGRHCDEQDFLCF